MWEESGQHQAKAEESAKHLVEANTCGMGDEHCCNTKADKHQIHQPGMGGVLSAQMACGIAHKGIAFKAEKTRPVEINRNNA